MRDAYRGGELVKNNRMGDRDRRGSRKSRAVLFFPGARYAADRAKNPMDGRETPSVDEMQQVLSPTANMAGSFGEEERTGSAGGPVWP